MPIDLNDEPQDLKPFILAVPSKGRLEEKSAEIFSKVIIVKIMFVPFDKQIYIFTRTSS